MGSLGSDGQQRDEGFDGLDTYFMTRKLQPICPLFQESVKMLSFCHYFLVNTGIFTFREKLVWAWTVSLVMLALQADLLWSFPQLPPPDSPELFVGCY